MLKNQKLLSVFAVVSCVYISTTALAADPFDPEEIDNKTLSIVTPGYVGQPLTNNYLIADSTAYIYVPSYNVETWSGNLKAFFINSQCKVQDKGINIWPASAAEQLNGRHFSVGRHIVTTSESGVGIPFRWNNLSNQQRQDIGDPKILNYVRGDRSMEGQAPGLGFRKRESVLGDIIRSTPLYWNEDGKETLFVGANDGMLHAFDAKTGGERFAFIPSQVIPKLKALKEFPYKHKFFVDGQFTALRFNPAQHGAFDGSVRSVLVGALGAGGQGLFALDIGSIPTSEAQATGHVLWEISNATPGFANLGHVYGKAQIARLNNGWPAVITGNGYNNSGNGKASLLFINPITGAKMGEVSTGEGSKNKPNGLSSPTAVDVNLDGLVDYAYAGDIDGNLWKFDLTSNGGVNTYTVEKLFKTDDKASITMAPVLKRHSEGGRMVVFATGRTFSFKDVKDKDKNYVYGIWDRPDEFKDNNKILEQKLKEEDYKEFKSGLSEFEKVRTITNHEPKWKAGKGNHYGWKVKLDEKSDGERVVGDGAFIKDNTFIFLTSQPGENEDKVPQGDNWWMQINAMTGGEPSKVRFDLNRDNKFTDSDKIKNTNPAGVYIGRGTRSQFIALTTVSADCYQAAYDGNSHKGIEGKKEIVEVVTVTEEIITEETEEFRGVKGGHFDADVYHGSSFSNSDTAKHVHEYDDDYNVTGLNLLDPSNDDFDLTDIIANNQKFKVLVQNQYLSPAAEIHLDGKPQYKANSRAGFVPLKLMNTTSDFKVKDAKSYNTNNVKSLVINLPVDAFTVRDWWGGHLGLAKDERVGLHPTETGCVTSGSNNYFQPVVPPARKLAGQAHTGNGNGTSSSNSGVRHNGALTIQIVDDKVKDQDIEMVVPGSPEYGWQVKPSLMSQLVYAEYTFFWHNKDTGCYGESGWHKNPEQEGEGDGDGKGGKDKDKGGDGDGGGGGGNPLTGDPNVQGGVLGTIEEGVTVIEEGDTTIVIEITKNPDGSFTKKTTTTSLVESTDTDVIQEGEAPVSGVKGVDSSGVGGVVNDDGSLGDELFSPSEKLGRVNWRELRR